MKSRDLLENFSKISTVDTSSAPKCTSYPTFKTVTIFLTYMVFIVATAVTVTISSRNCQWGPDLLLMTGHSGMDQDGFGTEKIQRFEGFPVTGLG
jgi:hypothetical protein